MTAIMVTAFITQDDNADRGDGNYQCNGHFCQRSLLSRCPRSQESPARRRTATKRFGIRFPSMAVKLKVKKHSTAAKYCFGTTNSSSTMLMSAGGRGGEGGSDNPGKTEHSTTGDQLKRPSRLRGEGKNRQTTPDTNNREQTPRSYF